MPDIIYRYKSKNTGRYVYLNEDQLGQYPDAIIYMTTPDGSKADLGTVRSLGMAYGDYEPDLTTEQRFNRLGIFFNEDTRTWQNGDGRIKISTAPIVEREAAAQAEPTREQRLIAIGYGLNPSTGNFEYKGTPTNITQTAKQKVAKQQPESQAAREIIESELTGVAPYGGKINTTAQSTQADIELDEALNEITGSSSPSLFDNYEVTGEPVQDFSTEKIGQSQEQTVDEMIDSYNRVDYEIPSVLSESNSLSETVSDLNPQPTEPVVQQESIADMLAQAALGQLERDNAIRLEENAKEIAAQQDWLTFKNDYRQKYPDSSIDDVRQAYAQLTFERMRADKQQEQQEQEEQQKQQNQGDKPTGQNIIQRVGESIASAISPASANATTLVDNRGNLVNITTPALKQPVGTVQSEYSANQQKMISDIRNVAQKYGVDENLLLNIAWNESRFNPNAKSSKSSAKGLFQITNPTWKDLVKNFGSTHGITSSGVYDPVQNATGSALLLQGHQKAYEKAGIPVNNSTLYMGNFLGRTGAINFLNEYYNGDPNKIAATSMVKAAEANPSLFYKNYDKYGTKYPRTYAELFDLMGGKLTRTF